MKTITVPQLIKLGLIFNLFNILLLPLTPMAAMKPDLSLDELFNPPPRIIRTCCSFGTDLSIARIPFVRQTDIVAFENLGEHHFLGNDLEGNGNIYTKRAGFIDLGHLRDCADWTAYLYSLIEYSSIYEKELSIILGSEGGDKVLTIDLCAIKSETEMMELAGSIAYDLSVWHEIATWFGTSYIPMIPERYSSFSPEDLYSNLMGVHMGIQALKSKKPYAEAMTQILSEKLLALDCAQDYEETYEKMRMVEDLWWTDSKALPSKRVLIKRYIDKDDSFELVPWVLPADADTLQVVRMSKPAKELREKYSLEIKLNYKFPRRSIFPDRLDRIITNKDFGKFLEIIEKEDQIYSDKILTKHQPFFYRKPAIEN